MNWQQFHLHLKENSVSPSVESLYVPFSSSVGSLHLGMRSLSCFLNSIVFLCLICLPSTLTKAVSYVCSLLSLPRESCFLYSVHAWSYNSLLSSRQSHIYRIDLPSFLSIDIRWCCYKTFRVFVFVLVIVATNIAKIILWRSSVAHM